jgi:hypothetical protein
MIFPAIFLKMSLFRIILILVNFNYLSKNATPMQNMKIMQLITVSA